MTNDLISREAAIKMIRENGLRGEGYSREEREDNLVDMLECLPAVDAAPVVHGRWTEIDASYWRWRHDGAHLNFRLKYRHDECGEVVIRKENFCPNCGAKMDKEANY